ncbi:MAG: hypothetical protein AB7T49_18580 [Oligoflexales bacterium]
MARRLTIVFLFFFSPVAFGGDSSLVNLLSAFLYNQVKIYEFVGKKDSDSANFVLNRAVAFNQFMQLPKFPTGFKRDVRTDKRAPERFMKNLVDPKELAFVQETYLRANPKECQDSDGLAAISLFDNRQARLSYIVDPKERVKLECLALAPFLQDKNFKDLSLADKVQFLADWEKKGSISSEAAQLAKAALFVAHHKFSAALNGLFDLQTKDSKYVIMYDVTQRAYSYMEHGKGNVALKGL